MAKGKVKSLPVFRQPKEHVYSALCGLNQAFESLAAEIESLKDSDAIPLATLKLYRVIAEELRAAINHRITGVLHVREARDRWKFQQSRITAEKKVREVGSKLKKTKGN